MRLSRILSCGEIDLLRKSLFEAPKKTPKLGNWDTDRPQKDIKPSLPRTRDKSKSSVTVGHESKDMKASIPTTKPTEVIAESKSTWTSKAEEQRPTNAIPITKSLMDYWLENGLVAQKDWDEQIKLLEENEKLQYDPDDPFGRRLPLGHPGRQIPKPNPIREYTLVERYKGRGRRIEKKEWAHFQKGLHLHSAPPYPEMQQSSKNKNDQDGNEVAPLYMPNEEHYIPSYSQQKRISKVYGPSYSHYISLPAVTLPRSEEVFRERKQRQRERARRKLSSKAFERIKRTTDEELQDILVEYVKEMEEKKGGVGLLSQWSSSDALLSRKLERWDKRACLKLRHEGDPNLHPKVKQRMFDIYLDSIDKNNTLAPWQKNLAFNLIPKALGGPWGKFSSELDTGPKEKLLEYNAYVGTKEAATMQEKVEEELDDLGL